MAMLAALEPVKNGCPVKRAAMFHEVHYKIGTLIE